MTEGSAKVEVEAVGVTVFCKCFSIRVKNDKKNSEISKSSQAAGTVSRDRSCTEKLLFPPWLQLAALL